MVMQSMGGVDISPYDVLIIVGSRLLTDRVALEEDNDRLSELVRKMIDLQSKCNIKF